MSLKSTLNVLHDMLALIPRGAWAALSVAGAVVILLVGMRPSSQLPNLGLHLPYQDKVLHFIAYSLLASLVYRAKYPFPVDIPPAGRLPWLPMVLAPFLLGSLDEFFQGFAAGRSQDPFDLMADTLAGIAVCVVALNWRASARRRLGAGNR